MTCKHCGKEIEKQAPPLEWWIHKDGFYNCAGRSCHSEHNTEPSDPVEDK